MIVIECILYIIYTIGTDFGYILSVFITSYQL